jgi:recombination protein RecA
LAKSEIKIVRAAPAADIEKAAETVRAMLDAKYGKGTLMKLSDKGVVQVEVIPTGIYTLDRKGFQVGGVPKGRVIEVFGPESSGKTTITLQIIAAAQAQGGQAAFVDAEHALDPSWAEKLGVDVDNLFINQPDSGEQALEVTLDLVNSGAFSVIVVDSVAALVPKAELDGEMGDSHVGLQARLMSQALRKLTGAVARSRTTLIFINQIREKIGVMFGNPETTTGGRALRFYSSIRIDVRRIAQVKDGDVIIGGRTKIKFVKNKVAPPFKEVEVDLLYKGGYDRVGDLLDYASSINVVDKSGAWYSYKGERIGQGREKTRQFLTENEEIFQAIYDATVKADQAAEAKAAKKVSI